MRFCLGLAVSVAVALLLVGRTIEHRQGQERVLRAGSEGGSWASSAELAWLARVGRWDVRLRRGLETAATVSAPPRLGQALAATRSCTADLERSVGSPPTERLEHAFGMFLEACRHLQRFGLVGTAWEANGEAQRAADLLSKADQSLPPGEVRALPVIAGETRESRVEPRFGRIAGRLARKPIQARCWSRGDWPHLMREEQTYTHGQLDAGTLAFASIGGSRINLGPRVCKALADLVYRRVRPADEAAQLTLATAVVTLSHEPQHSKGIAREATAECNAIQISNRTAMELGVSAGYAASLVRTYWRHYADELPAYRSPECRKGGALDLGYADSIWQ